MSHTITNNAKVEISINVEDLPPTKLAVITDNTTKEYIGLYVLRKSKYLMSLGGEDNLCWDYLWTSLATSRNANAVFKVRVLSPGESITLTITEDEG